MNAVFGCTRRSFLGLAACAAASAGALAWTGSAAFADAEAEAVEATGPVDVNVAALKGPTAMGMVKFMAEADAGEIETNAFSFQIEASSDTLTPLLAKGEVDIAAIPANLASVLYNNNDGFIEVLAINVLGVLYICEVGEAIETIDDLVGKTIYASGKGSTPQYALEYILSQNGIDVDTDVTVEWKSEHSECVAALVNDPEGIAMLPQPFVTTAQNSNENIRVALDLTAEWDAIQERLEQEAEEGEEVATSALVTGVVVARREFAEANPQAVEDFMERLAASVEFVNENTEEAAELVGEYEIVTAAVAQKALPACSITYIDGAEMKEKLSGYLQVLFDQNESAVGGALPEDDFYYVLDAEEEAEGAEENDEDGETEE